MKRLKISILLIFTLGIVLTAAENSVYDKERAEQLYIDECSKCHRKSGKGIKRIYPPLKNADYVRKSTDEELLRGMLFGRSGTIVVNGKKYNGVMTTEIDENLSDAEIAMILTYVYRELNGIEKTVKAEQVADARKKGKLPEHK